MNKAYLAYTCLYMSVGWLACLYAKQVHDIMQQEHFGVLSTPSISTVTLQHTFSVQPNAPAVRV